MLTHGSSNTFTLLITKNSYVTYTCILFSLIRCITVIITVCCLFFTWFHVRGNISKNVHANYKTERYVKGNKKKTNL